MSALLFLGAALWLALAIRLGSARALVLALALCAGAWLADSAPRIATPFATLSAALAR